MRATRWFGILVVLSPVGSTPARRVGARPFDRREMDQPYRNPDGMVWSVTNDGDVLGSAGRCVAR